MFDVLERIRADLALVAEEQRVGWSALAQADRVCELAALRDRVDAEFVRAVAQWDAERGWEADGACTPAGWLVHHTPLSRADAHGVVRAARLVREHGATATALADGHVTAGQVRTIAAVTRNREDLYVDGEHALLDAATRLDGDDFTKVARHWRNLADDAIADHDAFAVHERRFLHTSKTLFGTFRIDGELDLDGGETFLAALAALDGVDPSDRAPDGRTGAQRNADNLVQLARSSLDRAATSRHVVPSATLVADLDLLGVRAFGARRGHDLDRQRDLERLGPVARATAQRLVCDAEVARIVTRGRSEVLDLGRASRVVSPAQRRALVVRDRGCVFPGCDRPPGWCDAHHLRHWTDGGPTDLVNLALLCRRHHVLCHEGGWQLARGPDGQVEAIRPTDTPPSRHSVAA